MMDALREYILSVVAAAILCGIVQSLTREKGSAGAVVKLLCGLFLAFTVIRPVASVQLEELSLFTSGLEADAVAASALGQESYLDSLQAIIKAECEAYILDKAQALEVQLTVDIHVSSEGVPDEAILTGSISPYARETLQTFIQEDLGIPKERQVWIG